MQPFVDQAVRYSLSTQERKDTIELPKVDDANETQWTNRRPLTYMDKGERMLVEGEMVGRIRGKTLTTLQRYRMDWRRKILQMAMEC